MDFEFSIADRVNVRIIFDQMTKGCVDYIRNAYEAFLPAVKDSDHQVVVQVSDAILGGFEEYKTLGKDGFYKEGVVHFHTGHRYERANNTTYITIPKMVKRGRVKFKRPTPGRHVTDEVLEPFLINLMKELGLQTLHASTYLEETGVAVVNVAWRGTGKTEKILPLIGSSQIMSDDLVIYDSVNHRVHAYPRPIRAYSYNIESMGLNNKELVKARWKSFFTPRWRPVFYVPIKPKIYSTQKFRFLFLNDEAESARNFETIFDLIMDFETSHFQLQKSALGIARILRPRQKLEK